MPYRVKDENGHEYTQALPAQKGQKAVDKPALDRNGRWAAPKYQNSLLTPQGQEKGTPAPADEPTATKATTEAKEATA